MALLQARLPFPWLAVALCFKDRGREQGYLAEDWLAGLYQKEEGRKREQETGEDLPLLFWL